MSSLALQQSPELQPGLFSFFRGCLHFTKFPWPFERAAGGGSAPNHLLLEPKKGLSRMEGEGEGEGEGGEEQRMGSCCVGESIFK